MRSLRKASLLFLTLYLSSAAVAQSEAGGNHGDPFRKEWRRQKLRTREILKKMTVDRLLPNAAPEVRDWLSEKGPNGKSKLEMLEEELAASEIDFVEITKENPEGHNPDHTCAQTDPKPGAKIWISKIDCGHISPSKMWEVLVGDTTHHFNFGDEFSDYVSMAVVQGYKFHAETDPTFALRERYRGIYRGKQTILTLDVSKAQPLKLTGGLEIDLSRLPALGGSGSKYGTSGNYSSFSYSTWTEGIGKDSNGKLGYGELEGTRRYHSKGLNLSLSIAIDSENDAVLVQGYRDVKGRGYDETDSESFTIAMLYYAPTPEEIEAKRIATNTAGLLAVLDKPSQQFQPGDEAKAIELYKAGVNVNFADLAQKAVRRRFWKLVDMTASYIPKDVDLSNLVFTAVASWDPGLLKKILERDYLKEHIKFDSKQNYRTAMGEVIYQLYDPQYKSTLAEREARLVPLIETLLEAGVTTKENITDIINVPRRPLSSVVGHFGISAKAAEALIKKMPEGEIMAPDDKDRTPYDYMAFYWNILRTQCGPIAEKTPKAKAKYDSMDERFRAVYTMMKAAGHNGERRGCFYYDTSQNHPVCEYDEKSDTFRFWLEINYRTKPRNWAQGSQPPAYWDICG